MSIETHSWTFRIVGKPEGQRMRAPADRAYRAYAACGPAVEPDKEAYLGAFCFGDDFRDYLNAHGTTKGYGGSAWAPRLTFDIDREGDIETALTDARTLVGSLVDRHCVPPAALSVFWSGAKGFAIELPTALWMPPASIDFPDIAKEFCLGIAHEAGVTIDPIVFTRVQPLRAPNSRHRKTGLFKRRIDIEVFDCITAKGVLDLARAPEPFDVPSLDDIDDASFLIAAWDKAARAVEARNLANEERRHEVANGTRSASINRQTRLFLNGDVQAGDRHRLLFSAAANLAEAGCSLPACRSLLFEPARDVGLPPKDIERGIVNGFESVFNNNNNNGGNAA